MRSNFKTLTSQAILNYHSAANAFFARAGYIAPSDKKLYDELIRGLITDGLWPKFDFFYVFAAPTKTAALQNLVSSGFTALETGGTPTFTAYQGYIPTVSGTDYLDPQFNCNTAGQKFAQDSAHLGIWSLTAVAGTDIGAVLNNGTNGDQRIASDAPGTKAGYRINTSSGLGSDGPVYYPGHVMWSRTASNAWAAYGNGVSLETGSDASKSFASNPMRILNAPVFGGGNNKLSFAHVGSALSDAEVSMLYTRLQNHLKHVGAI